MSSFFIKYAHWILLTHVSYNSTSDPVSNVPADDDLTTKIDDEEDSDAASEASDSTLDKQVYDSNEYNSSGDNDDDGDDNDDSERGDDRVSVNGDIDPMAKPSKARAGSQDTSPDPNASLTVPTDRPTGSLNAVPSAKDAELPPVISR